MKYIINKEKNTYKVKEDEYVYISENPNEQVGIITGGYMANTISLPKLRKVSRLHDIFSDNSTTVYMDKKYCSFGTSNSEIKYYIKIRSGRNDYMTSKKNKIVIDKNIAYAIYPDSDKKDCVLLKLFEAPLYIYMQGDYEITNL